MIKRIASLISAAVICFLILPFSVSEANAEYLTGYPAKSALIDDIGLYKDNKQRFDELNEMIADAAAQLDLNLMVYLSGTHRSDTDTMIFADDSYDEIFGENTNGIFYYLDLSGISPACDWISTSGKAMLIYKPYIDDIFYHLDNYLPPSGTVIQEADISRAIEEYINKISSYKNSKPKKFACEYDEYKKTYSYMKNGQYTVSETKPWFLYIKPFVISSIVGLISAFIAFCAVEADYESRSKTNPRVYVSNDETMFRRKDDIFLRSNVTKTKIETSSSGGGSRGGGGGGGHSHGGSHGGGGHHR